MIVRISGTGQYEIDDDGGTRLDALDTELTRALHAGNKTEFHRVLEQIIEFVQQSGSPLGHERVVRSDVIIPPEDITLEEAHRFFTDEGLLHPVPA